MAEKRLQLLRKVRIFNDCNQFTHLIILLRLRHPVTLMIDANASYIEIRRKT